MFLKLNFYLLMSVLFGPFLAVYFSFFGDFYSLSKTLPIFDIITEEWLLVLAFSLFWIGFYFMLSFWRVFKKVVNMPPKLDWWQKGVIYEIYAKTFNDSNNDGVGDLRGITQKLDYLKKIGVSTIWLTPIYPSGGKDGGYDVTSFVDIDRVYGTMKDFDELVARTHERGMYLLMDLIPNHTSDQHEWFKQSRKSNEPNNPYRDYYVWHPSKDKTRPPNNWVSVFGGSAWTYCESRQAWYLHQFLPEQPDLNYRCPAVHKEMKNVLKFWLEEKNIDGFRVDAFKHLYENDSWDDEPYMGAESEKHECGYNHYNHVHTANLKETFQVLKEWRAITDEISRKTNSTKALIMEAEYDVKHVGPYYRYENSPMAHLPFNFQFCSFRQKSPSDPLPSDLSHLTKEEIEHRSFTSKNVKRLVNDYEKHLPRGSWANWQLGNHDNPRVASRIGRENVDLANVLNLLLGGTAIVYYGEEIGMEDLPKSLLKFEDSQDEFGRRFGPTKYLKYTRDFCRTPMQWNSLENAGFTAKNVKPWLPLHPNYSQLNVEKQLESKRSHLKIFMDLMELRQKPSFQWGEVTPLVVNDQVFSFIRNAYDFPTFLVVMNISDKNTNVNLLVNSDVAPRAYVAFYIAGTVSQTDDSKNSNQTVTDSSTAHYKDVDLNETYKLGAPVLTKNVFLKARDCLVLTWHCQN